MGMQVSRGVHTEVPQEEHIRMGAQRVGTDHARVGPTERSGGGGRALDGGSCAHVVIDPAEVSVSGVVGFIKGKSAIAIARRFMDRAKNFVGQNFWARGYYVSTVGRDEEQIRNYIREQEKEDKRLDQLKMFD